MRFLIVFVVFFCFVPLQPRAKLIISEEMDGPGRDIAVDNLISRTFRNLLARPSLAVELIADSELIPGLLDLADAVTDIALGNAGELLMSQTTMSDVPSWPRSVCVCLTADGANDRSIRMLRTRQRDLSAVQVRQTFAFASHRFECRQLSALVAFCRTALRHLQV